MTAKVPALSENTVTPNTVPVMSPAATSAARFFGRTSTPIPSPTVLTRPRRGGPVDDPLHVALTQTS
jgi:hypothetical protein